MIAATAKSRTVIPRSVWLKARGRVGSKWTCGISSRSDILGAMLSRGICKE
jgi:hypothetical protein